RPLTPPPPRSAPSPYTTLFRSRARRGAGTRARRNEARDRPRGGIRRELGRTAVERRGRLTGPHDRRRECRVRTIRGCGGGPAHPDRKSTRLNSSHVKISYAVFC